MFTIGTVALAIAAGLALTAALGYAAASRLRRRHAETWARARLRAASGGGLRSPVEYLRFWWSGEYRSVGDVRLDVLVAATLVAFLTSVGLALFAAVVFFWSRFVAS